MISVYRFLRYLDLLYPEYAFRLRVVHPAELVHTAAVCTNMKAIVKDKAIVNPSAMRELWWRHTIRHQLHSIVLTHPSLGPAVRLAKVWAEHHLLGGFEDLIEHLMVYCYVSPGSYDVCYYLHDYD